MGRAACPALCERRRKLEMKLPDAAYSLHIPSLPFPELLPERACYW